MVDRADIEGLEKWLSAVSGKTHLGGGKLLIASRSWKVFNVTIGVFAQWEDGLLEEAKIIPEGLNEVNDFTVSASPLEDFQELVIEAGLVAKAHSLRHGETFKFERIR